MFNMWFASACICTSVIVDACADSSAHFCVLVTCMYLWSLCIHVHVKTQIMLYLHIRARVCECMSVCIRDTSLLWSTCSAAHTDSCSCYTEPGGC